MKLPSGVIYLFSVNRKGTVVNVEQRDLITCRECKHRYVDGENVRYNVCDLNHNKVQADDWFCADAERRENDDH